MKRMKLAPGDHVRIRKSALDLRSQKRGEHEHELEVVVVFESGGEPWAKIRHPLKGTTTWPSRMLRRSR